MEIRSHTLFPLFMSGSVHSGSASRDDWPNVPREVACELDCGIVSPPRLRWVDGVSVLSVTCHPQFWQNDRGFFTCHCGNTGVEWTTNKSQHTKLILEKKKFSRCCCRGSNSQPFDHESGAVTSNLSRLPDLEVPGLKSPIRIMDNWKNANLCDLPAHNKSQNFVTDLDLSYLLCLPAEKDMILLRTYSRTSSSVSSSSSIP